MNRFDEAMNSALSNPKYNILTGRAPDIRRRLAEAAGDLLDRFIQSLIERLSLPELTGSGINASVLFGIFIFVAVTATAFIIYFTVKRVKNRAAYRTASDILHGVDIKIKTVDSLLAEAADFAQNGCYRDAVRYEFIALLLALNQKNVVHLQDYKTNGQLKNEVKQNGAQIYDGFCMAAETFNRVWFGNKTAGAELYGNNNKLTAALIGGRSG